MIMNEQAAKSNINQGMMQVQYKLDRFLKQHRRKCSTRKQLPRSQQKAGRCVWQAVKNVHFLENLCTKLRICRHEFVLRRGKKPIHNSKSSRTFRNSFNTEINWQNFKARAHLKSEFDKKNILWLNIRKELSKQAKFVCQYNYPV